MEAQRIVEGDSSWEAQRDVEGDSSWEAAGEGAEAKDLVKKMRISEVRRREKGIPIECVCGVGIALEISRSPKSCGEKVFRCGYDVYGGGDGCGFRMWFEDALFEEFEKIKDKKLMQQRLDQAIKRIDNQEGRIYEMHMQYEEIMADRKQLEDYDGELGETQMGLEKLTDKHDSLERKVRLMERKFEKMNK